MEKSEIDIIQVARRREKSERSQRRERKRENKMKVVNLKKKATSIIRIILKNNKIFKGKFVQT